MEKKMQTKHISDKALAARWSMSYKTLQRWREENRFLPYFKLGKSVRYPLEAIELFEAENITLPGTNSRKRKAHIPNRTEKWGLEWQS